MYIDGFPLFISVIIVFLITFGLIISLLILIQKDDEIKKLNKNYDTVLKGFIQLQRENTFLKCKYKDDEKN